MKGDRLLKLVIAYDGTHFVGWQRQKNARTVQETAEKAFRQILGARVSLVGAGRTDSGVHAEGQVAHVKIRSTLSPRILHRALNAILPEDVLIRSVEIAPRGFHARYSAKSKRYHYRIWNQPLRPLFDRTRLLHIPSALNIPRMKRVARSLQGRHDFRAFHSSGRPIASTIRTLRSLTIKTRQGVISIEAEADGFLYHMVRRIVGLLIEVGKGKIPPSSVCSLLNGTHRLIAPTAPAKGLSLLHVRYS